MPDTKTLAADPVSRKLLLDPDLYAATALVICVKHFGMDSMQWAPATLRFELQDTFNLPEGEALDNAMEQLLLARALLTTNDFFVRLPFFIFISKGLAGPCPAEFEPADVTECAWGVTEAVLIFPPDGPLGKAFAPEIRHYIAEMLRTEGFVKPPSILSTIVADIQTAVDAPMDEATYASAYDRQRTRTRNVDDLMKEKLRELQGQLQLLQSKGGL